MNRLTTYAPHVYFFFFFIAVGSYAPYLGLWLNGEGLTNQQIGAIYAIGPFVALFVQPVWGVLCDKYGIEKSVLMLCSLLTPALAFGYSSGGGFAILAATAVAIAVFSSPLGPLSDAVAVAHVNKRGQTYGGARVWGSVGFAVIVTPMGILYEQIGIKWMFSFYMAFMIAVFFIALLLERGSVRRNTSWRDIGKLLKNKELTMFLFIVFIMACGTQGFNVFFTIYISSDGGNVSAKVGWLMAVAALSEFPFFLFASRITGRFGYRKVLSAGAFAMALRLFAVSFGLPMPVLLATQLLHGISFGLFYAAGVQYANELSPPGSKATGQSLFSMVYANVAILIASNAGGWLIDYAGFGTMFRLSSLLCVMGGIGFLTMRQARSSRGVETYLNG